ncbi:H/ACA ribonucleoprotein complex non-core subunit NAF1 [Cytospora mali]|uniref:H/ACA ribonucleoprotein complex non-core subunit NAF1 n=1 Tax=Cytospora mali TaxID=578113 RepID=A0A194UT72_CYTMA|nr:H/ACA ribonucleoprotein complex non-core subunit NAF1 [Valsa mali var. pyri (nom. inval.)]
MDSNFSIPGLGQLPSNETAPTSIEAPENPTATASTDASRDTEMTGTNPSQREASEQAAKEGGESEAQAPTIEDGAGPRAPVTTTAEHPNSVDKQVGEEDVRMEDQVTLEQNATKDDGAAQVAQDTQVTQDVQMDSSVEAKQEHQATAEAKSPPASPRITGALEAALDSLLGPTPQEAPAQNGEAAEQEAQDGPVQEDPTEQTAPAAGEGDAHTEWEVDSSPYESSSSDSSDDSSDDDDDSDVDESKLLGIEETARLLMEADGGSDDEMDGARAAKQAASVRTKNELPDEPEPKPAITISAEDIVAPLGIVQHVVEGTQVVIEALRDGAAVNILDRGTVLCKEDRSVLGVIHDTIATVHRPMYILKFRSDEEAKEAALEKGSQVWYPKSQAKFVFPSQLRMEKGSDASNLHDEEVGPDEVEYSDDEQEQAHKREKKNRKRGAKGKFNRGDDNNSRAPSTVGDSNLNYGEEEDGTYNKLPRPANFGMGLPAPPPPGVSSFPTTNGGRGGHHSGRRGDSRGRGGRGRGYNGRGRGGGQGYTNNNSHNTHPLPPPPVQPQTSHQPPPPFAAGPPAPGQWSFPMPHMPQFGGVPPAHSTPQAPSYPMPNWGAASTQPNPFPFPPMPPANWSNPQQHQQQQQQRPPPQQQTSWTPPTGGYGLPQQYPPSNGANPPAPAPNYQYPNYYGGQTQGNQQQRWG